MLNMRKQRLRKAKELAQGHTERSKGPHHTLSPGLPWCRVCVSPGGRTASQSKGRVARWAVSALVGTGKWKDGRSSLSVCSFGGSWSPSLPHLPSPFTSRSPAGHPPTPRTAWPKLPSQTLRRFFRCFACFWKAICLHPRSQPALDSSHVWRLGQS